MDDLGVADAFYTLISIAIVMMAALAVSGVVLSTTMKQGKDVSDRMSGYGESGMEKGSYGFYYSVDTDRSDFNSVDPNGIVLKKLVAERDDITIDLTRSSAPPAAPGNNGAVIWSGYIYVPSEDDYVFELKGQGCAWMYLDHKQVAYCSFSESVPRANFTQHLAKGYRPFKLKFAYQNLSTASCTLCWQQGENMVRVSAFYR
jgi:hypothetical protein